MSAPKGGGAQISEYRSLLQPKLVELIAGLRRHQVEDAVDLLLNYIDRAAGSQVPMLPDLGSTAPRETMMSMNLCEAKKVILRPGQPYVFLPDEECESCRSDLGAAVRAYGLAAVNHWLALVAPHTAARDGHARPTT